MALLTIENLRKSYRGVHALDGVSLSVPRGQIVAVTGANGAGKSTLLRLLAGLERPSGGRVLLDGSDVTGATAERMARRGVVYVGQAAAVFAELSVLENVLVAAHPWLRSVHVDSPLGGAALSAGLALGRWADGPAHAALVRRAERLLGRFGGALLTAPDAAAETLGPAARRRLALVRALVREPRLLLLDEPSAGLNPTETAELARVLAGLRQDGIGVMLVEQKLPLVLGVADQVVVLEGGRVVG